MIIENSNKLKINKDDKNDSSSKIDIEMKIEKSSMN